MGVRTGAVAAGPPRALGTRAGQVLTVCSTRIFGRPYEPYGGPDEALLDLVVGDGRGSFDALARACASEGVILVVRPEPPG